METFEPWLPLGGAVDVARITMCGVQCPMAKGSVSISFAIELFSSMPPALGDLSMQFTAKHWNGTDSVILLCVTEHFGTKFLSTALGTAEANQTAQAMVI